MVRNSARLAALLLALMPTGAYAQWRAVTTCGSPPTPYVENQLGYPTMDLNGVPCGGSSGTFTWPGTATPAAGGISAGAGTMPYVNAYLAGGFSTLATTAKQDAAKTVLDAIAASVASIDNDTSSPIPTQPVTTPIGGVSLDPCSYSKKTFLQFSTATGTLATLGGMSAVGVGNHIYICEMTVTVSAQTNFALVSGTNANCAAGAAIVTSTSASDATKGMLLGPGASTAGGLQKGNGGFTVAYVDTTNSLLCSLFTTTNAPTVSGMLSYVASSL